MSDEGVAELEEAPEQEVQQAPETQKETSEMRAAITDLAGTVKAMAEPKPEPTKELSQDEKDELWAVYNPEKEDPDFFKKWMRLQADMDPEQANSSIAERKKLFASMQKGLVKQSVVGAKNLFDVELQKVHDTYKPVLEYVTEQKAEKTRNDFYTTYPSLKTYTKIIAASAKSLDSQDFKSKDDYFKALAESAAGAIKEVIPDFDLGAKPQEKKPGTPPRLPRSSVGSSSGAGAGQKERIETTARGDIDELG